MAKKRIDKRSALWRSIIEPLIEDGEKVLRTAIETADYTHRTHNLEDSYAFAIYHDGYMVEDTMRFLYPNPKATERKEWYNAFYYGRYEAEEYLLNYRPRTKGISFVMIAAMPYGEVLEHGGGNLKRKYKVITGANSAMRELAAKVQGRFGRKAHGTRINISPIS